MIVNNIYKQTTIFFHLIFLIAAFFTVTGCSSTSPDIEPCSNPPCNSNDDEKKSGELDFEVADTTVFNIQTGVTYQTITAFSASDAWATEIIGQNYSLPVRKRIVKKLFSMEMTDTGTPVGIGLSGWRFMIGSDRGTLKDSGLRPSAWRTISGCFLSPDGTYHWNRQKGSRWFLRQAKSYGVEHIIGFTVSPPYFMTKTGYTFGAGNVHWYNLAPKKYDDFAEFLAKVAKHFSKQGIPFDLISPLNEPQWTWYYEVGNARQGGSQAKNKEIANVVRAINAAFEKYNVETKIMIPEAGSIPYLYSKDINKTGRQIYAFWSPSSPYYIGGLSHLSNYVAGHSYWSNNNVRTSIDVRKRLVQEIKQVNPNLQYAQTEFSILDGLSTPPPNPKPIDYALYIARVIFNDLVYGNATAWSFWTTISTGNANKYGLFGWRPKTKDIDNSAGKVYAVKNLWMYGNFSRFVRPGMERVEVENRTYPNSVKAGKNVMATAFVNNAKSKLVMVIINYTDKNQKIVFSGIDIQGTIDGYRTNATLNLAHHVYKKNSIKIKGKSIVTLVMDLK